MRKTRLFFWHLERNSSPDKTQGFFRSKTTGPFLPNNNHQEDQHDHEDSESDSTNSNNNGYRPPNPDIIFYTYKRGSYDSFEKHVTEAQLEGMADFTNGTLQKTLSTICHMLPKIPSEDLKEDIRRFQMQANPQSRKVQELVSGNSKLSRLIDEHIFNVQVSTDVYVDDTTGKDMKLLKELNALNSKLL